MDNASAPRPESPESVDEAREVVVVVLAGFVWAAREDGRAQRRQDRLSGRRR
jgi:hypothetical protein